MLWDPRWAMDMAKASWDHLAHHGSQWVVESQFAHLAKGHYPWIPTYVHGYILDMHRYPLIAMDIGYSWMSMDIHTAISYNPLFIDIHRIPLAMNGYPLTPIGMHG